MSRRTLTLLLSGLLAVALVAVAGSATVPYVALGPGPTFDTLGKDDGKPVLAVSGRPTFPTDGQLDLTTVGVNSRLTLVQALRGWFESDLAVVPREVIYPPGETREQVDEQNAADMVQSQSDAVLAAARQLGFPIAKAFVDAVPAGSPSAGILEPGDRLLSVDGVEVRDNAEVAELVRMRAPGEVVRLEIERDGAKRSVEVTAGSADDPNGGTRTVIGIETRQDPIKAPFDVEIGLQDVGGPSAGLMFTLGILDKLGEPSLTGGKYIAGTGEISPDGQVGPIGGITLKLIAAKRKGAVAFLVPADNCAEAVRNPPTGLPLIEVGSVTAALDGLQALRRGEQPRLCPTG